MEMVPYEYCKMRDVRRLKKTKNEKILDEFFESGNVCVELVNYTHVNAKSVQSSLNTHIRRRGMQNIVYAKFRNGHVFLVRLDKVED